MRWGATLARLLRAKKRVLRLELPWRPVLAMLRDTHLRECVPPPRHSRFLVSRAMLTPAARAATAGTTAAPSPAAT